MLSKLIDADCAADEIDLRTIGSDECNGFPISSLILPMLSESAPQFNAMTESNDRPEQTSNKNPMGRKPLGCLYATYASPVAVAIIAGGIIWVHIFLSNAEISYPDPTKS